MTTVYLVYILVCNNKSNIVYVQNRVSEILTLKEDLDICLLHVSTTENPADILSRRCSVAELRTSTLRLNGPSWLCEPSRWPKTDRPTGITSFEIITQDIPILVPNPIFPFNKFFKHSKLLNVTSKVFVFLHKVSKS